MPRPLPKEIKIGALTYPVVRVSQAQIPEDNAKIDVNDGRILVRKRVRCDRMKLFLLHELLHATHYHTGNYQAEDLRYTDEQWIDATVPGLLQMIVDNPALIEYLTGRKFENLR